MLIEENKEKDLAIVAIMNKEVPYVKECIDYHIFVEVAYQPLVCTFYNFISMETNFQKRIPKMLQIYIVQLHNLNRNNKCLNKLEV